MGRESVEETRVGGEACRLPAEVFATSHGLRQKKGRPAGGLQPRSMKKRPDRPENTGGLGG
jgi:hypothetical protein